MAVKSKKPVARPSSARVAALRQALTSVLSDDSEGFLYVPAREHFRRASDALAQFDRGNASVLALRQAAISSLVLLELALRARRLDDAARLAGEGREVIVTLDPSTVTLLEAAARRHDVSIDVIVDRALRFYAAPILEALAAGPLRTHACHESQEQTLSLGGHEHGRDQHT